MYTFFGYLFITSFLICCMNSMVNSAPPNTCTGSLIPDPDDCSKYYACVEGKPVSMFCSSGLNWNEKINACDWPQNTQCNEAVKPVTPTQPAAPSEPVDPAPSKPAEPNQTNSKCGPQKKSVCYFTSWSWYRQGAGKFIPEDIDANLCTNVIYAFAVLDPNTYTIKLYEKITALKSKGVKVSIAIGGWSESQGSKYGPLLTDPQKRQNFANTAADFLEKYNFDGLDLDMEYPACWQGNCEPQRASEKGGFVELTKTLNAVFKPKGLLLSAAVAANPKTDDSAYDIPNLSKYLDWINLMSYDYHGSFEPKTGQNAPLDTSDNLNVKASVDYWIRKGAPAEKIILGIPTYGQSFTLVNPQNHDFNAPSSGAGQPGQFTQAGGTLAYYEICANTKQKGWTVVRDSQNKIGPYAYKGNQWVGFDDVDNVRAKANYVCEKNLGGTMIWTLDFDDSKGSYGCGKYPLLTAINQVLRGVGGAPVKNCT